MVKELTSRELRYTCDPALFRFPTTADLAPLDSIIGQERAVDALKLGLGIKDAKNRYNIYVAGDPGTGKMSAVEHFLGRASADEPQPPDLCYVHNFENPYNPRYLELPAGKGRQLRTDLEQHIKRLQREIPKLLESDEFKARSKKINERFGERRTTLLDEMETRSRELGFADPADADRHQHPAAARQRRAAEPGGVRRSAEGETRRDPRAPRRGAVVIQERLQAVAQLDEEREEEIKKLAKEAVLFMIEPHFAQLKSRYEGLAKVARLPRLREAGHRRRTSTTSRNGAPGEEVAVPVPDADAAAGRPVQALRGQPARRPRRHQRRARRRRAQRDLPEPVRVDRAPRADGRRDDRLHDDQAGIAAPRERRLSRAERQQSLPSRHQLGGAQDRGQAPRDPDRGSDADARLLDGRRAAARAGPVPHQADHHRQPATSTSSCTTTTRTSRSCSTSRSTSGPRWTARPDTSRSWPGSSPAVPPTIRASSRSRRPASRAWSSTPSSSAGDQKKLSCQFGHLVSIVKEASYWARVDGAASVDRAHVETCDRRARPPPRAHRREDPRDDRARAAVRRHRRRASRPSQRARRPAVGRVRVRQAVAHHGDRARRQGRHHRHRARGQARRRHALQGHPDPEGLPRRAFRPREAPLVHREPDVRAELLDDRRRQCVERGALRAALRPLRRSDPPGPRRHRVGQPERRDPADRRRQREDRGLLPRLPRAGPHRRPGRADPARQRRQPHAVREDRGRRRGRTFPRLAVSTIDEGIELLTGIPAGKPTRREPSPKTACSPASRHGSTRCARRPRRSRETRTGRRIRRRTTTMLW